MAEKTERDFMITLHKPYSIKSLFGIVLTLFVFIGSCTPDLVDSPIPRGSFDDFTITISNHQSLLSDGGYIYRPEGARGMIIYRKNSTTYYAFERNCSFQPGDACATVDVHASTLFMEDTCCGSHFNFEGTPTGGPAWRPLLRYETSLSGNTLTITDSIVE